MTKSLCLAIIIFIVIYRLAQTLREGGNDEYCKEVAMATSEYINHSHCDSQSEVFSDSLKEKLSIKYSKEYFNFLFSLR